MKKITRQDLSNDIIRKFGWEPIGFYHCQVGVFTIDLRGIPITEKDYVNAIIRSTYNKAIIVGKAKMKEEFNSLLRDDNELSTEMLNARDEW